MLFTLNIFCCTGISFVSRIDGVLILLINDHKQVVAQRCCPDELQRMSFMIVLPVNRVTRQTSVQHHHSVSLWLPLTIAASCRRLNGKFPLPLDIAARVVALPPPVPFKVRAWSWLVVVLREVWMSCIGVVLLVSCWCLCWTESSDRKVHKNSKGKVPGALTHLSLPRTEQKTTPVSFGASFNQSMGAQVWAIPALNGEATWVLWVSQLSLLQLLSDMLWHEFQFWILTRITAHQGTTKDCCFASAQLSVDILEWNVCCNKLEPNCVSVSCCCMTMLGCFCAQKIGWRPWRLIQQLICDLWRVCRWSFPHVFLIIDRMFLGRIRPFDKSIRCVSSTRLQCTCHTFQFCNL